jgi:hypothetical protein
VTTASPAAPENTAEVQENVLRGTLLALITIPVGVIVFTIIYTLGYIAAIVAFGIAAAAYFLYRLGAGKISVRGAVIVSAITLVTLLLAFVVAVVWDTAVALSEFTGLSAFELLGQPEFWQIISSGLADPELQGVLLQDFGLSLLFGVLGAGALLFSAFKEGRGGGQPEEAAIGGELSAEEQQAMQDAAAAQQGIAPAADATGSAAADAPEADK